MDETKQSKDEISRIRSLLRDEKQEMYYLAATNTNEQKIFGEMYYIIREASQKLYMLQTFGPDRYKKKLKEQYGIE